MMAAEDDAGEIDAFADAMGAAFPEKEWDADSLAAMKEAIRICAQTDYAEEEEDEEDEKPGKGTLALIFGGKPKKEK